MEIFTVDKDRAISALHRAICELGIATRILCYVSPGLSVRTNVEEMRVSEVLQDLEGLGEAE